ncbi:conserved hypothetical protein [Theileria orientalis strain Shintoku]|uniref:Uncharacterized protein n=1 Tax=Theileria orientalis strain Shintoku TaxID=869250 RepID=J4C2M1_THEOR|nr:conserved hypothetical protein [Theileria orientalis strain Shintoku]BAM38931.1 conserved hypothetical protein [Theileria orientalis strain Shintoku]|eukprot:XP_009689232.1 conserved hypothetical protein [Theileria orientalis strain Shintoku]
MSTDNVALKLLNRTKYAQNRTKYYTVRNTVLSQTERPFFSTGSFYDPKNNRKLLSLKKAFLNRRASRRGPFQKFSLPHEYHKTFGDPSYYSHSELVASCVSASSENMCDSYFWKQICTFSCPMITSGEKIREVRDVISIGDLLKCVSSVAKVNCYDRDLFRVLSREFVDDVRKLSLEEAAELLHCYYRQNVYSCDLVNSVGKMVTSSIIKGLQSTESENSESEPRGVLGKIKDIMPGNRAVNADFGLRPLAKILRYCHYFGYANPDFYLSVAKIFIRCSSSMDFVSRLEMFTYLDPKLMFAEPEESSDSVAPVSKEPTGHDVARDMVSQLLDSVDLINGPDLCHENTFEMSVLLSSHLFRVPENSKLVHDLCGALSSSRLISKAVFRYASNCTYSDLGWREPLGQFLALLSRCCGESTPVMSRVSALTQGLRVQSPFVDSLENLFMDSMLTCFRVLNICWRLKLGRVDAKDDRQLCKKLSFSLEDDNVHSRFLREFGKLSLSSTEMDLISMVVESINERGCKGQSVENLTSSFECLTALINNSGGSRPLSLPSSLREKASEASDAVSMEIVRQLVDFDRASLYRVSLSLSTSDAKNVHLDHYVNYFPKITRRIHERHHVSLPNPLETHIGL